MNSPWGATAFELELWALVQAQEEQIEQLEVRLKTSKEGLSQQLDSALEDKGMANLSWRATDKKWRDAIARLAGLLSAAKLGRKLCPLLGGLNHRPSWFTEDDAWEAWVNLDEALRAAIAEAEKI
jgi:hypothetical protein